MSEKSEFVENGVNLESARLDAEKETLFVQTDSEYDEILASAQMSVIDDMDIRTTARICGPSGCGKTTLARSLAIDVKIADKLINKFELDVWNMSMDKLAILNHMIEYDETVETSEKCPDCESKSVYSRSTKTPEYKCQMCNSEFDTVITEEKTVTPNYMEKMNEISDIDSELQERNLVDKDGETTDIYPHSRADAYRCIYKNYTDGDAYPSSPYYEVTMSHAKYAKDLIGHPHIDENGTTFVKGTISKAVEASNDEAVVLALDEINRAPTSAKDELYSALDGRVQVSLDEAGGVDIKGNPNNIITISTMNKGPGHHVEPLDFAEKRRLSDQYTINFLGVEYPEKEIELIMENSDIPHELAAEMVKTANEIRTTAESTDANLSYGVPTGTLIVWAKKSYTNHIAGIDEPVIKAGQSAVSRAIYDHNEDEIQKVNTIIQKNMRGFDFFQKSEENSSNSTKEKLSETRYICEDHNDVGCSWSSVESKASSEATNFLTCPECKGELSIKNPGEI